MIELQVVLVLCKSSAWFFFFFSSHIIATQVHVQKEQNPIKAVKRGLHTVAVVFHPTDVMAED